MFKLFFSTLLLLVTFFTYASSKPELLIKLFPEESSSASTFSFFPNSNKVATGTTNGLIQIWDIDSRSIVKSWKAHEKSILELHVSSDGKRIISISSKGQAFISWDAITGKKLKSTTVKVPHVKKCRSKFTFADINKDSKTAVVRHNCTGNVQIVDINTGRIISTLEWKKKYGHYAEDGYFSPDSNFIILHHSGEDISLWNSKKLELVRHEPYRSYYGSKSKAQSFNPLRSEVAVNVNHLFEVYDVVSGEKLASGNRNRKAWFNELSYSPNGKWLIGAGTDGTLYVWDASVSLNTETPIFTSRKIGKAASFLYFSPDGKFALFKAWNEPIKIIDMYFLTQEYISSVSDAFNKASKIDSPESWRKFLDMYSNKLLVTASSELRDKAHSALISSAFRVAETQNTESAYEKFLTTFSDATQVNQAISAIYKLVSEKESVESFENFISTYPDSPEAIQAVIDIYNLVSHKNTIEEYQKFITSHGNSTKIQDAISAIYKIHAKTNKISSYESFLKEYPNAPEAEKAVSEIYRLTSRIDTIPTYAKFITSYKFSPEATKAISSIYGKTEQEDNIAGYAWFIENYPKAKESRKALLRMHEIAFSMAKGIGTLDALNDFIIAYPTAKQVGEATRLAYELEKKVYSGFFVNEEKLARKLLIQSKILEQSSEDLTSNSRMGYMMVVNRMNDLLKVEFNTTDAALRHLESNEFRSFVKSFKKAMESLDKQLASLANSTSNLASLMESQSSMMDYHFKNAAQDRKMSEQMTRQHRNWERFIGKVGQ